MEAFKPGLIRMLFTPKTATFVVPAKTVSEANSRTHWSVKAKRTKGLRRDANLYLRAAIQREVSRTATPEDLVGSCEPDRGVEVLLTRLAPGILDDDNLASSLKGFRDGVADAFGKDDRDPILKWKYDQRRSKTYAVEVTLSWFPKGA